MRARLPEGSEDRTVLVDWLKGASGGTTHDWGSSAVTLPLGAAEGETAAAASDWAATPAVTAPAPSSSSTRVWPLWGAAALLLGLSWVIRADMATERTEAGGNDNNV